MFDGEKSWLLRKKVIADWTMSELPFGGFVVVINDKENNETLTLELQKKWLKKKSRPSGLSSIQLKALNFGTISQVFATTRNTSQVVDYEMA